MDRYYFFSLLPFGFSQRLNIFTVFLFLVLVSSCSSRINVIYENDYYVDYGLYPTKNSSIENLSVYIKPNKESQGGNRYLFDVVRKRFKVQILKYEHEIVNYMESDSTDYYKSSYLNGKIRILKETKDSIKVSINIKVDEFHNHKPERNKIILRTKKPIWIKKEWWNLRLHCR